ncbi:hypothetical protein [Streptomyces sp. KL116D]|uniref:hypothetical protein n=1 Tax=Streptomyces sp. KL116D TaxID=3045152 RepID=UPI003556F94F
MSVNPHDAHGTTTLSLAEQLPDGSIVYQSWSICSCTVPALRQRLGAPQQESIATAAQVAATASAVMSVPGATHIGEGL